MQEFHGDGTTLLPHAPHTVHEESTHETMAPQAGPLDSRADADADADRPDFGPADLAIY